MATQKNTNKSKLFVCQILLIYISSSFMSGCSVSPKQVTFEQRKQRVIQDWNTVFNQNDFLPHKMSMQMAMARALKYNLDIKIQAFESVLTKDQLDVSNFAMWPQLLGSLGYFSRSNENGSKSLNLTTNLEGNDYSASTTKKHHTNSLQFSWNLLDFGASYVAAKQNSDKFLIGLQRNRKMVQNVMRDVRNAYWQAYTAQEIERDLVPLMNEVKTALSNSTTVSNERLSPELDNLTYRRSLYDILRNLTELQKNLVEAKANLSSLTVVPPGSNYNLLPTSTSKPPLPKDFPMDLQLLEKVALYDRPELQEADYLKRISLSDIDKVRLQMLPGINLNYTGNYDSNKLLLNRSWADAGTQLSWNVLKIFSAPSNINAAKTSSAITDLQRMALSVVVITQVDVAFYRYQEALDELNVNAKLLAVESNIEQQMVKMYKEGTTDLLSMIRAKANRILAKLRHNLAYAEWQNAGGQLLSSIGYDLTAGIDTTTSIATITTSVQAALNKSPVINNTIKEIAQIPGFKAPARTEKAAILGINNEYRDPETISKELQAEQKAIAAKKAKQLEKKLVTIKKIDKPNPAKIATSTTEVQQSSITKINQAHQTPDLTPIVPQTKAKKLANEQLKAVQEATAEMDRILTSYKEARPKSSTSTAAEVTRIASELRNSNNNNQSVSKQNSKQTSKIAPDHEQINKIKTALENLQPEKTKNNLETTNLSHNNENSIQNAYVLLANINSKP